MQLAAHDTYQGPDSPLSLRGKLGLFLARKMTTDETTVSRNLEPLFNQSNSNCNNSQMVPVPAESDSIMGDDSMSSDL